MFLFRIRVLISTKGNDSWALRRYHSCRLCSISQLRKLSNGLFTKHSRHSVGQTPSFTSQRQVESLSCLRKARKVHRKKRSFEACFMPRKIGGLLHFSALFINDTTPSTSETHSVKINIIRSYPHHTMKCDFSGTPKSKEQET